MFLQEKVIRCEFERSVSKVTGGEPPDQGWLMTRLTGSCAGLLYFCSVLPGSELKVLGCDLDPTLRESCAG